MLDEAFWFFPYRHRCWPLPVLPLQWQLLTFTCPPLPRIGVWLPVFPFHGQVTLPVLPFHGQMPRPVLPFHEQVPLSVPPFTAQVSALHLWTRLSSGGSVSGPPCRTFKLTYREKTLYTRNTCRNHQSCIVHNGKGRSELSLLRWPPTTAESQPRPHSSVKTGRAKLYFVIQYCITDIFFPYKKKGHWCNWILKWLPFRWWCIIQTKKYILKP